MLPYAFLIENEATLPKVYTPAQLADAPVYNKAKLLSGEPLQVKYLFSSWGMPSLTEAEISTHLPDLQAVFYGAGTVQAFARPFLHRGVRVFSAWMANAVPVAEFAVAQIILANKGYFQQHARYKNGWQDAVQYADTFPGNYGSTVGLLGAGAIGRLTIALLKPYNLHIKVFDPFLPDGEAAVLGVEKTTLEDIFANCQTISNHLANNAQTKGMLNGALFNLMKPNATFINTGRGAQVVVQDLCDAMRQHPMRTALLDVTDPTEPLPRDHIFWSLPNIIITPHRAGSVTDEIRRMGAYMFEEYERVQTNQPVRYEVTLKMLETMA
jgi:phosphoglycerate dehydrogenase-like enzyme